jgi:hypothetical protein
MASKYDAIRQQAEYLRADNQKRADAQKEVADKHNQRIQQAYQGWEAVPENLYTKTQLKREKLYIPAGVKPVAEVYTGHAFYDLYRREDALRQRILREIVNVYYSSRDLTVTLRLECGHEYYFETGSDIALDMIYNRELERLHKRTRCEQCEAIEPIEQDV